MAIWNLLMSNLLRGSTIGLGCKGGPRHQLTGPAGKVGTRLSVGAWTVARATASLAETFASCHTGYEPVERTGGKKKNKIKKGGGGSGGKGDAEGAAIWTERVAEGRKLIKKGEPEGASKTKPSKRAEEGRGK